MPEFLIPPIPKDLLDWLVSTTEPPTLEDSKREIYAKLGEQRLIDRLQVHYNRQNGITKE